MSRTRSFDNDALQAIGRKALKDSFLSCNISYPHLTFTVFVEYKDAFSLFDRDNNGIITTRELSAIMRSLGFNPTEEELQTMINNVDYDGNGVIDFPEFVKLMEDQKKPDEREADMMLAFRIFDADNKGYIESAELRYIILNMDNKIPQDELDELIAIADLGRDRKITYQGTTTL
ncbi:Calmodulin [Acropora cervicornis]|uniref:Calmodulin n=1 Tax=Acropora cervicornis TaxID=6130 RepID=A0AAD9UZ92_ACRCE|nr:Calmodulin [Acropora cervicornis]